MNSKANTVTIYAFFTFVIIAVCLIIVWCPIKSKYKKILPDKDTVYVDKAIGIDTLYIDTGIITRLYLREDSLYKEIIITRDSLNEIKRRIANAKEKEAP